MCKWHDTVIIEKRWRKRREKWQQSHMRLKHCLQLRRATSRFPNWKLEESPCLPMVGKRQEEQKGKEENKSSCPWWQTTQSRNYNWIDLEDKDDSNIVYYFSRVSMVFQNWALSEGKGTIHHNPEYLPFRFFSAAANTVVGRCSKFLQGTSLMAKPPNGSCSECFASPW